MSLCRIIDCSLLREERCVEDGEGRDLKLRIALTLEGNLVYINNVFFYNIFCSYHYIHICKLTNREKRTTEDVLLTQFQHGALFSVHSAKT